MTRPAGQGRCQNLGVSASRTNRRPRNVAHQTPPVKQAVQTVSSSNFTAYLRRRRKIQCERSIASLLFLLTFFLAPLLGSIGQPQSERVNSYGSTGTCAKSSRRHAPWLLLLPPLSERKHFAIAVEASDCCVEIGAVAAQNKRLAIGSADDANVSKALLQKYVRKVGRKVAGHAVMPLACM